MIGALILIAAQAVQVPPPPPAQNADFTCRIFLENGTPETITGSVRQTRDAEGFLITDIRINSESPNIPSARHNYSTRVQLAELTAVAESEAKRFSWWLRVPTLPNVPNTTVALLSYEKRSFELRYVAAGLCDLINVEPTP